MTGSRGDPTNRDDTSVMSVEFNFGIKFIKIFFRNTENGSDHADLRIPPCDIGCLKLVVTPPEDQC